MTSQERECVFCHRRLTIAGLQTHLRSHTTEKHIFCKFCSREFSTGHSYQRHIKTQHPAELRKKTICLFCNKYYTLKSDYESHLRCHIGEKPFSCGICEKSFSYREGLRVHTQTHFAAKTYACDSCPQKFAKISRLRRHKTSVHERPFRFVCPMCPKQFHTKEVLQGHIKAHTKERAYKCTICDIRYQYNSTLKQHYLREHSGASYKVKCTICEVEITPWGMTAHLASHSKPHKCPVCEKPFTRKPVMEKHRKMHSERGLESFKCGICKKSFDTLKGRDVHQQRHTSKYPCAVCGRVFSGRSNRNVHMRIHNKDKRQVCVFCGNRFVDLNGLRTHILIHVEEKPWFCNECPFEARGSSVLKSHKRCNHDATYRKPEKVHACSMCEMKFGWKGNLIRHLRFHTGEKPYKCRSCNKRYVKKLTLDDHVKKHHSTVHAKNRRNM